LNWTYSASFNQEYKYMFDISPVQYLAPFVNSIMFQ